ncbi:cyclic nucleotide-binding domain-containing protein [Fervidobacterium sp. 2310opik-2]|uniref:cyclic nucleotide-binding domain-containing protein n=1 Tax=Fervidobacterium sp. 2310opik-2 TaxID=1755815 RepID=UPI0013DFECB5|nr:cyclic nucleotide-binding domain-containing protein [Fervidobacterium sp. 2310opik-2]KAF2961134.1 cyclic nucleotide-binding protein [Fervidobacterium sp. 2310opik-2]HOJ94091.1 cyclic nucleotide-binding domain-containing protein [Fervidobacterium nodosum]
METLEFKDNQMIIQKGEKGEYVYVLKSGKVKIKVNGYELIMTDEDICVFGLEALIDEPYTETCVTVGNVKVIRYQPSEFMEIYAKTEVGKKALESFMRRTAKVLGWI